MVARLLTVLLIGSIFSGCGGKSPTSPSNTVPNYAGAWRGNYTVTGCNQSGGVALANVCGALGSNPPYNLNLTQGGANVTGTFTLGTITFPNTGGTVSGTALSLSATTVSNGITVLVTWNLNLAANNLTGTLTQRWTSNTLSGEATVVGTINSATR